MIRNVTAEEHDVIHELLVQAFGGDAEARLVELLRASDAYLPGLELVDWREDGPAGYALATLVSIQGLLATGPIVSLAPVAVAVAFQSQGIGSDLVRRTIDVARQMGAHAMVVLGEPGFYGRLGFRPANEWGLRCPFGGNDGAFQAQEFVSDALALGGEVVYPPAFDALE